MHPCDVDMVKNQTRIYFNLASKYSLRKENSSKIGVSENSTSGLIMFSMYGSVSFTLSAIEMTKLEINGNLFALQPRNCHFNSKSNVITKFQVKNTLSASDFIVFHYFAQAKEVLDIAYYSTSPC